MQVVPVIDLQAGRVVRALRGERALYRPIDSPLARADDLPAMASALCGLCGGDTLYLADLDALQGGAVQGGAIGTLLAARPALRLWLDAGYDGLAALRATLEALGPVAARVTPVLASESWRAADELPEALRRMPEPLLSLDRRHGAPLDRAGLWDTPTAWPRRVIVMGLERVGSAAGPDLAGLAGVRERAPQALLVGAGGVRDARDLDAAAAAGAHAWLVASALHDGGLDAAGWHRHRSG